MLTMRRSLLSAEGFALNSTAGALHAVTSAQSYHNPIDSPAASRPRGHPIRLRLLHGVFPRVALTLSSLKSWMRMN